MKFPVATATLSTGNFLWISRLFGITSERIRGLVLPWLFLAVTGSTTRTSILVSAYQLPGAVLGVVLGLLIHRFGARNSFQTASALLVTLVTTLYFLYLNGELSFAILVLLSVLLGASENFQSVSLSTYTIGLAKTVNLSHYYARVEIADALSTIAGPLFGGLLVATGTQNGLLADAACLSISFFLFRRILASEPRESEIHHDTNRKNAFFHAVRVMLRPEMRPLLFVSFLLNIQGGTLLLLIVVIGRAFLHLGSVSVAFSASAAGVGAIVGSALSRWILQKSPLAAALIIFPPGLLGSILLYVTIVKRASFCLPLGCFLIDLSSSAAFVLVLVWNANILHDVYEKSIISGFRASISALLMILATLLLCSSATAFRLSVSTAVYSVLFLVLFVSVARLKQPSPWHASAQT